jgi:hypothetical protein
MFGGLALSIDWCSSPKQRGGKSSKTNKLKSICQPINEKQAEKLTHKTHSVYEDGIPSGLSLAAVSSLPRKSIRNSFFDLLILLMSSKEISKDAYFEGWLTKQGDVSSLFSFFFVKSFFPSVCGCFILDQIVKNWKRRWFAIFPARFSLRLAWALYCFYPLVLLSPFLSFFGTGICIILTAKTNVINSSNQIDQ